MREAKLCPSAIMEGKYLKAGVHLLISGRGREKRAAEGAPGGREGSWESARN